MPDPQLRRPAVLVVAAGRGSRAGQAAPKQYARLAGQPVLAWTLQALRRCEAVGDILVVIHPADRDLYAAASIGVDGLLPPVPGGATRQESVRLGLEALQARHPDVVLVHDAARPFVTPALVARIVAACAEGSGAVPGLAVVDTLKKAADGWVAGGVARDGLVAVQTPQGFPFADLLAAHRAAVSAGHSDLGDDAAVAALAGLPVRLVEGEAGNVKLTVPADFAAAERMLQQGRETRTGHGYDVHAFAPGDAVMLCGVRLPHNAALAGHSDADVGLHALTDALLGALGDGDIGEHFPPSDPQWKGAASERFLADAARRVAARSGRILHLDVTLVCEAPKIAPHRQAMREAVARIAGIAAERVSVKATTSEGLGFAGRREGMAALATATIELPGAP